MVFDEEPPAQKKWTQQATTSAFGLMESLKGQGSSLAKNLKNFGKSLVKEHKSQGATTPPEHRDDDIRLTWLTNRIVLADTLHKSKEGLLKAETAVVREMIDCQPYVVVNVHAEPLKLDGYAKSVHVPLGSAAKGGLPKYPTIQALVPILNEYCLLTNDAAIVIFGNDENVQITAAFCLIASRTISRVSEFMSDSLPNRFDRLPVTYHLFLEQTKHVCKYHARRQQLQSGAILNQIILEPGTLLIDGDLYVAIQQGINQLKVVEFSANSCRNRQGQLVFNMESTETVDDVVIFLGKKSDVKHPILASKFNTQLLHSEDSSIIFTSSEMDVSKMIASAMPVQDLRMIVNFATRRMPTLNTFQFDRYKLLCVRNDRELDGYQRSYGDVDSEDESPILRSARSKSGTKAAETSSSQGNFFDSLQFEDRQEPHHFREQRDSTLLDHHDDVTHHTADLLDGFTIGGTEKLSPANETPILSAPTPASSDYDSMTSSQNRRNPSPATAIDDLLGLGTETSAPAPAPSTHFNNSSSGANLVDFDLGAPIKPTSSASNLSTASPATSSWSNTDLLGGFSPMKPQTTSTPPNTRNPSASNSKPVSQVNSQADFEAFLSNYPEQRQAAPQNTQNVSQKTQQTRPQNTYKPAFGDAATGSAKVSMDAFSDLLNQGMGKRQNVIILGEGVTNSKGQRIDVRQVKEEIETRLQLEVRIATLGHLQRGGAPSFLDRLIGLRMGYEAVQEVLKGKEEKEGAVVTGQKTIAKVMCLRGHNIQRNELSRVIRQTETANEEIMQRHSDLACRLRGFGFLDKQTYLNFVSIPLSTTMPSRTKTFAVVHIGSPCAGMNAATYSFTRMANHSGIQVIGIKHGWDGLKNKDVKLLTWANVQGWAQFGGSMLGTKRQLPSEMDLIAEGLNSNNVDGLVIIGGFMAFESALILQQNRSEYTCLSIPIVVIPATISNNCPGTCMSLGVDTALNEICRQVDNISQNAIGSKNKVMIIETMGSRSGFLATMTALSTGSQFALIRQVETNEKDLEKLAIETKERLDSGNLEKFLLIRSEGASDEIYSPDVKKIFDKVMKNKYGVRITNLGYSQLGGHPSCFDRQMGIRMGVRAFEGIVNPVKMGDRDCCVIGLRGSSLRYVPVQGLGKKVCFEHGVPHNMWWLDLHPLVEAMTKKPQEAVLSS